ncbi:hypothetical protein I41_12040 [Lacipirellula limnantheis]|uniref:Uncharacterized protein n=1 Tax=Lacipirellula limnantheis TaxID=2528024 RepID=A0A517TUK2_9BACT|nr:hypothetical protein I41_12040 [Lacipirellula limnantheis]
MATRAAVEAGALGLRFEALEPRRLLVGDLELLQDINSTLSTSSSNPADFVEVGSVTFFTATTATHGRELWKSDGTAAGTTLVKDIGGLPIAFPRYLTNVGGTLYFSAADGATGEELWKSDGTAAGTTLVKDIRAGASSSASPSSLTNVGGTLYFRATNDARVEELWKSDGTAAGTLPVRLADNSPLYSPRAMAVAADRLFITGTRPDVGAELFSLSLSAPAPGDYDGDSLVDGADFLLWQRQLGSLASPPGSGADGNGSGDVDAGDLDAWSDNFGDPPQTVAQAAASALFDSPPTERQSAQPAAVAAEVVTDSRPSLHAIEMAFAEFSVYQGSLSGERAARSGRRLSASAPQNFVSSTLVCRQSSPQVDLPTKAEQQFTQIGPLFGGVTLGAGEHREEDGRPDAGLLATQGHPFFLQTLSVKSYAE